MLHEILGISKPVFLSSDNVTKCHMKYLGLSKPVFEIKTNEIFRYLC